MDVDVLRAWIERAVTDLGRHRSLLDEANVFPVADSDTGTNLYLTLLEARRRVRALPDNATAGEVAAAAARGALVGARGNSGVIVGQYLGALWRALLEEPGAGLRQALASAARAATAAVATPVPGTVLTVADQVATGAAGTHDGAFPGLEAQEELDLLEVALDAGWEAVDQTPDQLDALRLAGVVDAGAVGLLIVLEALLHVAGRPRDRVVSLTRPTGEGHPQQDRAAHEVDGACTHAPDDGEFEVMALLAEGPGGAATDATDHLCHALVQVGVSVAVVSQAGLWQTHVHTDHPGVAVRALHDAAAHGLATDHLVVRDLARQSGVHSPPHRPALGLVAVTCAVGLAPDLARAGAVVVLTPDDRDVTAPVARAVADTGAEDVLVLASAGTLTPGPPPADVRVHLMPGLDDLQLVAAAQRLVECGHAGHGAAELLAHAREAADLVRSTHLAPGDDPASALRELLDGRGEAVTVLTHHETPPALVEAARQAVHLVRPDLEVVVLDGGAPGTGVGVSAG
ncbi:DAK2 domain-containing protein [Cellulomonas bogoriensis]|uniref:Dihydroxyacetone kinase n=1 Tax=Cellulomonas bogoriensis 69B4 = DSM 16987 TaxID=1386082 RepID=A0A0A0BZ49_9CELL|nr:DAK2 domain-containing protein [Cellulomonas bogoriensis]KGM12982.1 dihydroxyacetone kinase [Cellulomonas bogoriensis 69B4 = DSM 16987]